MTEEQTKIPLPSPQFDSGYSIEKALLNRHSVRSYADQALSLDELGQLLWSCLGTRQVMTLRGKEGMREFRFRTVPSAGALYPLEAYVMVKQVEGLEPGLYHYLPGADKDQHSLALVRKGEFSTALASTANNQACIKNAAVNLIIAGVVDRTAKKYGSRAERYVLFEVGHAAENVCLQAMSLGVGTVMVGAFSDGDLNELIGEPVLPLYIISMGKDRDSD